MLTVTTSRCRNLTLMFALFRAQPQVGENTAEMCVPVIGLLTSFSRSVIAKAAAVATRSPTRVAVVRTRCKAQRFYARRLSGE